MRLLLVDEAAGVDEEMYMAVRPMLAVSGGSLWLMSTPHGKQGFFYETWVNGGPEWERKTMGARYFGQEYGCEFEETESGVFDRALVEKAIRWDIKPLVIPW